MKFPGYFLIVADFIQWAKGQGIPVGPGRGSGAGSLVAYALTITDVDPLRFSLLFERFLNPARVSMPDFDIDFCQDRRDEVIRYVVAKYGREQVGADHHLRKPAGARGSARCRPCSGNALRAGRPDLQAGAQQSGPNPTPLNKAIEEEPRFQEEADKEPAVGRLLDIAQKLEGLLPPRLDPRRGYCHRRPPAFATGTDVPRSALRPCPVDPVQQ